VEVSAIGEDARVAVHPFDLDTEVKDLGGGRFAAEMSERWWVERGPNGGYVAAVILRAIQAAAASARAPRSLTVQFPRAPLAGPVEITVRTEREGHTVTFLSARMEQDGELQATALAVLADDLEASGFEELSMPTVEPAAELYSPDPAKVSGMPRMFQNYSVRPALARRPSPAALLTAASGSGRGSRGCSTRRWPRRSSTPGSRRPSSSSTVRCRHRRSTTPCTSAPPCPSPALPPRTLTWLRSVPASRGVGSSRKTVSCGARRGSCWRSRVSWHFS
jgi:hypothetical protein